MHQAGFVALDDDAHQLGSAADASWEKDPNVPTRRPVATTMVAADLGISPGNLYYHYPGKDGKFAIKGDLPDGKYTVEAYLQKAGAGDEDAFLGRLLGLGHRDGQRQGGRQADGSSPDDDRIHAGVLHSFEGDSNEMVR